MIFLVKILGFINILLGLYKWIVIIAIFLSWFNPNPMHEIIRGILRAIYTLTEPPLAFIRSKVPTQFGGLDFAPMILLLAILFVQYVIIDGLQEQLIRMVI
jgi:YggT family protein